MLNPKPLRKHLNPESPKSSPDCHPRLKHYRGSLRVVSKIPGSASSGSYRVLVVGLGVQGFRVAGVKALGLVNRATPITNFHLALGKL